jgi:O-antigen/teichoic acid export membrane protein
MNAQQSSSLSSQSSGLSSRVRDMWQRNQDLLRNAGSLAATTGLTSIFGFVFTIVAAKMFTTEQVGFGNAAINAMQLFGTIGMFGLNTMLIGELPKRHRDRGGLFAASLATSAIGSVILGLIFAITVGIYFNKSLPGVGGTLGEVLLFVVGTGITGATLVFDEGTIGLLRGGVQLWRNMATSALKLAILPVTAVVLHDGYGVGLSVSWVVGTALSMIPASIMLVRGGSRIYHRPDWQSLRRLLPVAVNHNWLNLAMATPSRIIPIVVVVVVGGKAGGVFYVAWMISSLLFMVPVHLGTVLFALASASPQLVAEKLRFVLRVSLLIGLPVMAALAIGAHFMLGIYKPEYAQLGTVPLWLLIIGYIPQMPRAQFIAVSRATNKVGQAAGLICTFAIFEITSIYLGGRFGGLDGLSFAYLGVLILEGLITAPTVLRAAYAHTAAATGSFPAVSATAPATGAMARATGPLARVTGELIKLTGTMPALPGAPDRQESGLAALFAIASAAVASDGNTLNVATEVWRTGSFPAIPANATTPRKPPHAATSLDMFGGRPLGGRPLGDQTVETPQQQLSYRRRQQAGVDALLAIATQVDQSGDPQEEPRGDDQGSLITNRNIPRS